MSIYQNFKTSHLNRGYNIDGYFGAQCWDGYAEYCRALGVPFASCTTSGYVKDLWNNRQSNGILNYFTEVETMEPGDVAIFAEHQATPSSHVAIFDHDAGGGYGWFLGQNQGGTPYPQGGSAFNLVRLPYSATFTTAFRPKANVTRQTPEPAQAQTKAINDVVWIQENATMTTSYPIYARTTGPSTANPSPWGSLLLPLNTICSRAWDRPDWPGGP